MTTEKQIYSITATPEWRAILVQTHGNATLARQILGMLAEELPAQYAEINILLSAQQWAAAASIVHKIHGSCSFCGLATLQKLCADIETELRGNVAPREATLLAFRQESTRIIMVLDGLAHRE
ncbi:MAG: Hpt domain-containing protein [Pseudomonadota bacterium]